jgi:hypothetical protein
MAMHNMRIRMARHTMYITVQGHGTAHDGTADTQHDDTVTRWHGDAMARRPGRVCDSSESRCSAREPYAIARQLAVYKV